jgi:hypothetical protein
MHRLFLKPQAAQLLKLACLLSTRLQAVARSPRRLGRLTLSIWLSQVVVAAGPLMEGVVAAEVLAAICQRQVSQFLHPQP